jgi:hypothetical protein
MSDPAGMECLGGERHHPRVSRPGRLTIRLIVSNHPIDPTRPDPRPRSAVSSLTMLRLRRLLRYPFTADPWRRTAEVLIQPFGALASLGLVVLGRRPAAHRALEWPTQSASPTAPVGRLLTRALLGIVLGGLAALIAAYAWLLVPVNLGYPLRPDSDDLSNAWGGPTMAGAWAVHGTIGLVFLWIVPWIVRSLSGVKRGLDQRLLRPGPDQAHPQT